MMPLDTERFSAHLIVYRTALFPLALAVRTKIQGQENLLDRDVFLCALRNVKMKIIKLPARNVGDGVNENFTCHWQLQFFLNTPSSRRKNIPLFQYHNSSHAKGVLHCKLASVATFVFMQVGMVGISAKFLHVRPSVCMNQHVPQWTDYSKKLYWRQEIFRNV